MAKTREEYDLITAIMERADGMGVMMSDRMTLAMDLDNAHTEFNLKLQELLKADDLNFSHDIVGIQNNINRRTKKMENLFVPRYANLGGR